MKRTKLVNTLITSGVLTLSLGGIAIASPCRANPCAPRSSSSRENPCAAKNPCAANNPCAASNPDRINLKLVTRPNNYLPYKGNRAKLVNMVKNYLAIQAEYQWLVMQLVS